MGDIEAWTPLASVQARIRLPCRRRGVLVGYRPKVLKKRVNIIAGALGECFAGGSYFSNDRVVLHVKPP